MTETLIYLKSRDLHIPTGTYFGIQEEHEKKPKIGDVVELRTHDDVVILVRLEEQPADHIYIGSFLDIEDQNEMNDAVGYGDRVQFEDGNIFGWLRP